ncbi:amidohydrolase family protein, partial [bacterium]|nr:amidohydrolase family protein [bacterium]
APFGVIGLETAFPVLYTELVEKGMIPLNLLIEKMTIGPARILKLNKGTLGEGADADVVVLDLATEFEVDPSKFFSRSHNCPWNGKTLKGRPSVTIVGGRVVFRDAKICV